MRQLISAISQIYNSGEDKLQTEDCVITRAARGMNGIIYRVSDTTDRNVGDLAVKIAKADERDRAGREYAATLALHQAGHSIAPEPIHLEYDIPAMPGVTLLISTWLPGQAMKHPPNPHDKRGWRDILYALAMAHELTPADTQIPIPDAVMPVYNPGDLLTVLAERRARLDAGPAGALTTDQIDYLLHTLAESTPVEWENPAPVGLILCDPNPSNMMEHHGIIRLVDWENSGWADPAFEIADLCAQPQYFDLPDDHRAWIRAEHGRILTDLTFAIRAEVYERMMNVFWVIAMTEGLTGKTTPRLEGVSRYPREHFAKLQTRYWERACSMLEISF